MSARVRLPPGVRPPFEVYVNGVPQSLGSDYRVTGGDIEIGAAWKKESEAGNAYLSVSLDDPSLPETIACAMVKTGAEHGYSLVWERRRKPKPKARGNSSEF